VRRRRTLIPEREEPTWRILADTGVLANDKI
jgi:hypothetical protein